MSNSTPNPDKTRSNRLTNDCAAAVTDGGRDAVQNPDWIAEQLAAVPIVTWDRFVVTTRDGDQCVDVYGWIDRDDDAYKDFVWTRFWPASEWFEYTTSSDEYTDYLAAEWFGDADDHADCRRVEDAFDIANAVELHAEQSLDAYTDGGTTWADGGDEQC